jgi:hypothetical protein
MEGKGRDKDKGAGGEGEGEEGARRETRRRLLGRQELGIGESRVDRSASFFPGRGQIGTGGER